MTNETLPWVLKQVELKALRTTASGQVGRLYQLASEIIQQDSLSRSADELKQIALDVRNAASTLDDTLHAIVGPMLVDPEPGKEEIAE